MAKFFGNMTRPSGYLASPKILKDDIAAKLREMWEKAYSAENSGRVAVLLDGLEWKPMSITSVDAQLIESYRMTIADVARVYRVPLAVIGETGGATYGNTETLIRHWLSTGLSYVVEHIELALDALFELPPDEFIAFDLEYLLRADFQARIEGLTKGIQGGLFSPNEARQKEGLPAVEYGEEPRVQAQVVPLSFASKVPAAAAAPTAPSAPSTTPPAKTYDEILARLRSMDDAA
jgi:HK97 family phage portal protein